MGLFNFGKKQNQEKAGVRKIDLKSILSEEEIRLLITDLTTVASKVQGDGRAIVTATAGMFTESGVIPVQGLDLCFAAVQDSLGTFSAFGMIPAGHTALLEKLKKMKEER